MQLCSEYIYSLQSCMSFIRKYRVGGKIYLAEVESRRIEGKVVQRFIRYVGRQPDGQTNLAISISDVEVSEVRLWGPLLVLHHLAKEIGLPEHLGPYANEILSMVYAHCLNYRSLNHMRRWFTRTDLSWILQLEQLTEERLVRAMDFLEQTDGEKLQRTIFASVRQRYHLKPSGVIYDVTNTYLYGKKCPLAQPGHDKEGVRGGPLIQIGLGITLKEGIPLFHKVFDGNISDSRTLHELITAFRGYGLRSGTILYDRGITSARNVKEMKELGWNTIGGLPLTPPLQKFCRPLLSRASELRLADRVQLKETTFYVTTHPYQLGTLQGTLYLCFNPQQQVNLRDWRRQHIVPAQQRLREGKTIKPGLEKFLDARGKVRLAVLRQAEQFDGYSCIFSLEPVPKTELIPLYFGNDLVEKAFHSLKSVIRLRPIRHWLEQRLTAHVFLCYLAYLLLSLLKYRLRPLDLSPEKALDELDTMYKVYLRDTKRKLQISRLVTLTKKQEDILKTIDHQLLKTM
jgi:transposase